MQDKSKKRRKDKMSPKMGSRISARIREKITEYVFPLSWNYKKADNCWKRHRSTKWRLKKRNDKSIKIY